MPTASPTDTSVLFKKNLPMLSDSGSPGFSFTPPSDPAIAQALLANTPFPDKPLKLAEGKLTTSNRSPIIFSKNGAESIVFSAEAGAFAGFGIYTEASQLLSELPADQFVLPNFDFNLSDEEMLSAIRWGFSASAKASGAMALGAVGTATLSAEASGQGLMAVIRRLPKSTGARDVLQTTADNWRIPRQVHIADDLDPGTWLLVDLLGSVSVKLGAQVGFDFSWIREIGMGEISGDIGLRLQLGIKTAVGFQAGGKLALVVSRETTDKTLRLRLIKLANRQFQFAVSAAAVVDPRLPELPQNADDFIKAVFGVHGQQIVSSLAAVEKWTDKDKKLSELLATHGIDGAENLIAHLAGVEVKDLQKSFDRVHERVTGFIKKWRELPHAVASTLMKSIDEKVDLDPIKDIANMLATSNSAGIKKLLEDRLKSVSFLDTPAGKYLESIATGPLLNLLSKPNGEIRKIAALTLKVLDGSIIEETLKSLQFFSEQNLNVGRVLDAASKADFKSLDGLLRRKLADFLGKTSLDSGDFDRLRISIGEFLRHRQTFYEKALEAMRKKYNFEITHTFQKESTDQVLLDVHFDFSTDPAGVQRFFDGAIRGDFDFLFVNPHPGISIGLGEVTHGVTRQTHTEITLPFLRGEIEHVNQSIASAKIEEQDGRVLIYTADSSDRVANNERISVLSLAMGISAKELATPRLRVHQNKLEMNYSMLYARREMEKSELISRLKPIAKAYFPRTMKSPAAFAEFVDARSEEVIVNGPKSLGNVLLSLQVAMPEEAAAIAGAAWLELSSDKKDARYAAMAAAIRTRLRGLIVGSYFTEAERFRNRLPAKVLLAYAALDPALDLDIMDKAAIASALGRKATVERMVEMLKDFQNVLAESDLKKEFRPQEAGEVLKAVPPDDPRLTGMLFAETRIIDDATKAGVAIGKFVKLSGQKPTEAVKALAEFGANLTRAFNSHVINMYVGDSIHAIGTEVFLAATRGILGPERSAELPEEGATAMLTLEFMKPEIPFDPKVLLARGRMTSTETILVERVVEA